MINFVGIALAFILGIFMGRLADRLFNKKMTLNPTIFAIVGAIGGALGAFIAGRFASGSFKTVLLQMGVGIVIAGILLVVVLLARGSDMPIDAIDEEDEDEEEDDKK